MPTGFEIDNQNIAREQLNATLRLARAIEELVEILRTKVDRDGLNRK